VSILEVPGARLAYEAQGSGPLMLMIPGATGSADSFKNVADHLAAHYTVVTYDRRGFSRSLLAGPQDDEHRLETDADDARRLIQRLSDEPAFVFGSSSGGIVALEVLTRHPSLVRTLVPYEPPLVRLLPDGQEWLDFFSRVYDLYRQSGVEPALALFREHAFAESDRQIMGDLTRKGGNDRLANAIYWFEHELRQYPATVPDFGALNAHADRIIPMVGRESRGYPCYEASMELGKRLGREVIELPSGHVGFVTHPAALAHAMYSVLPRGPFSPNSRSQSATHSDSGGPPRL
jgi:pimeloyl-ACP methyl ester carboxylesterase